LISVSPKDSKSAEVGAGLVTSRCNRKDSRETRPYTITRHVRQALPRIYAMKTQAIAPEYSLLFIVGATRLHQSTTVSTQFDWVALYSFAATPFMGTKVRYATLTHPTNRGFT